MTETSPMFTVKRLEPETITASVEVRPGVIIGTRTQKHVTFAVIDCDGQIVKDSRGDHEIYGFRSVAQMAADWYNGQAQGTR